MQIDPRNQRTATDRTAAGLAAARSQLEQLRSTVAAARENLALSRENLRRARELWAQQLTTRQALDQAESEVKVREANLRDSEQSLGTQEQRIRESAATVSSAKYELSRARIESPIDGLIVRRNIEQGETVVTGTMNNAGTVLLQIADMSIIEAEVEVDETDIPFVQIGQPAKVKIDAIPDKTFTGKVTEVGNSPIVQAAAGQTGQTATNFKVTVTHRRPDPRGASRLHLHRRRHDGDAGQGGGRADPGDGRAGADLRRGRQDRPAAQARPEEAGPEGRARPIRCPPARRGRTPRASS